MEHDVVFIEAEARWHCRLHKSKRLIIFAIVDVEGSSCGQTVSWKIWEESHIDAYVMVSALQDRGRHHG